MRSSLCMLFGLISRQICMLLGLISCQTSPPPVAPVSDATGERPASSATATLPAEPDQAVEDGDSDYLTFDHGCALVADHVAEDMLRRANAAIVRAGEHPSPADLDEILPLLHRAAYGRYLPAQRRYGYYVVGYWFTDEMFWPNDQAVAVSALAMLRLAAQHDRAKNGGPLDDALLEALATDPVTFADPDALPPLPDDWVNAGVEEALKWRQCVADH